MYHFESIYFIKPNELDIFIDRISSHYSYEQEITIDYENIPSEFQFLDHTVKIAEINMGNPVVYVLEEELVKNRNYDQFHIDFNQHGLGDVNYGYGISSEGVWMDRADNTYKNYEELEKLPNKDNIQFITTKQKLEIYFHDSNWTEAMLPKQFIIRGYTRSDLVSESINVRLE